MSSAALSASPISPADLERVYRYARVIAAKRSSRKIGVDYQEMVGVAYLAIAEAIFGFDPSRGDFAPRAIFLVRRRIQDHCRSVDVLSRKCRKEKYERLKARSQDELLFDRRPDREGQTLSLEAMEKVSGRLPTAKIDLAWVEQVSFDKLLNVTPLSKRERRAISLYREGWVMVEVAEAMGVNESRISQLIGSATKKLRARYLRIPLSSQLSVIR